MKNIQGARVLSLALFLGLTGCGGGSAPSSLASATAESGHPTPAKSAPASVPKPTLESAIAGPGLEILIRDAAFLHRLNAEGRQSPLNVQHGKLLAGTGGLREDEPFCQFSIGQGFADRALPYTADPKSAKQLGQFGSYILRFSLGNLIGAECTDARAGSPSLSLDDFREIVGDLLLVTEQNSAALALDARPEIGLEKMLNAGVRDDGVTDICGPGIMVKRPVLSVRGTYTSIGSGSADYRIFLEGKDGKKIPLRTLAKQEARLKAEGTPAKGKKIFLVLLSDDVCALKPGATMTVGGFVNYAADGEIKVENARP